MIGDGIDWYTCSQCLGPCARVPGPVDHWVHANPSDFDRRTGHVPTPLLGPAWFRNLTSTTT